MCLSFSKNVQVFSVQLKGLNNVVLSLLIVPPLGGPAQGQPKLTPSLASQIHPTASEVRGRVW